ncbi:MAG TPA: APC family permease [Ilumatobacteraceae bacterium]|nr:APC family permease [Ilumatobacteraceae bacterium]
MPKLKRILIGKPLSSAEEQHQRLSKKIALPVFASDAISSSAYAVDEIMVVITLQAGVGGAAAFRPVFPIAIVVAVLLTIVTLSYRQTIHAYPSGGGAYIVSRENLGRYPSLVAGSALLTDYILTVAVSVAGGVLAIRTAFQLNQSWAVPLCLACIFFITVMNLRGVKESGATFAGPTYFYMVMVVILVATGLYRIFIQHVPPIPLETLSEDAQHIAKQTGALGLLMLLRAFSSGAVALSGVEAISNGVPAFKKPEAKNAAITLGWMSSILGFCFLGIAFLAWKLHPFRGEHDGNGLGLMAEYLYNGRGVLFWLTMIATFAVLILAANTAYADFPRLSSLIAKDGFLPRQFFNRGARLVFSNGVLFLAIIAGALIVAFGGDISKLIPLYAFGVFTGFTLSQSGMVVHHFKEREPR